MRIQLGSPDLAKPFPDQAHPALCKSNFTCARPARAHYACAATALRVCSECVTRVPTTMLRMVRGPPNSLFFRASKPRALQRAPRSTTLPLPRRAQQDYVGVVAVCGVGFRRSHAHVFVLTRPSRHDAKNFPIRAQYLCTTISVLKCPPRAKRCSRIPTLSANRLTDLHGTYGSSFA